MADRLRGLGYAVDDEVLRARAQQGQPIGRPHLSRAVVDHPDNARRLADEGLDEITPFLVRYLIDGKPAFVGRTTPTIAEAIDLIHAAGGVAVWAHPFWDVEDPQEVLGMIDRYVAVGLDGVEVFYKTHTAEHVALLAARCSELDLLQTGSADYHGPDHKIFSRFLDFHTFEHEPRLGPIAAEAH